MDREKELMNRQDDAMEIDLLELFRAWKKKIWLILLVTFLGGSIGFAFSKLALTPQFTSTAMMYVLSKETTCLLYTSYPRILRRFQWRAHW